LRLLYLDQIGLTGYLGGSHRSLLDVLSSMRSRGHDVALACPYDDVLTHEAKRIGATIFLFRYFKPFNTRIEWRGFRTFNWFAAVANLCIYGLAGVFLFRLIRKCGADVVHSNDQYLGISAGLACKAAAKPCIWHVRAIPSRSVPRILIQFYGLLGRLLADRILVNSKATGQFLLSSPARRKVSVVYNGIDVQSYLNLDDGARIRRGLNIPFDEPVVAIFGRVIPLKGHDVLVEAIHRCDKELNPFLLIVGHYDEAGDHYRALQKRISLLGLDSQVRFAGHQSDIRPYLAVADMVVSASIEAESFGRTLVEGMAAGKPIIATRIGGHTEVVKDGVTGVLVDPASPEALSGQISRLIRNPSLAASMGRSGRERAIETFGMDNCADQLEGVYRELVQSSDQGHRI
jgi:glycosyltransferase involved in cell wall biosynthesis